ncbi:hypothetical protein PROFUN_15910 [Planoprotostelium fungivorum]|uniref:Uncharacterized protein n=1 Tax=Planoprotostelium fungivorum TaxID=1890364 RepID=A0A2P6MSZ1_9EUKA|nr:hypothetical protein PROFUN_15910 [Planoprotostelium fungivorum]
MTEFEEVLGEVEGKVEGVRVSASKEREPSSRWTFTLVLRSSRSKEFRALMSNAGFSAPATNDLPARGIITRRNERDFTVLVDSAFEATRTQEHTHTRTRYLNNNTNMHSRLTTLLFVIAFASATTNTAVRLLGVDGGYPNILYNFFATEPATGLFEKELASYNNNLLWQSALMTISWRKQGKREFIVLCEEMFISTKHTTHKLLSMYNGGCNAPNRGVAAQIRDKAPKGSAVQQAANK